MNGFPEFLIRCIQHAGDGNRGGIFKHDFSGSLPDAQIIKPGRFVNPEGWIALAVPFRRIVPGYAVDRFSELRNFKTVRLPLGTDLKKLPVAVPGTHGKKKKQTRFPRFRFRLERDNHAFAKREFYRIEAEPVLILFSAVLQAEGIFSGCGFSVINVCDHRLFPDFSEPVPVVSPLQIGKIASGDRIESAFRSAVENLVPGNRFFLSRFGECD